MNIKDTTMNKIQQLPNSFAEEVSDFIEFLLMRRDSTRWQLWQQFIDSLEVAESDFSDYLSNLEDYEEHLARGEIKW